MKNLIPKKIINDCHNNSRAVKGRQQAKKNIVKVLEVVWRSEISDCVLSPQAYLH
jgi:hypothetical protein